MAELDDYLDNSKTETERREAQEAQKARSKAEAEKRARAAGAGQSSSSGGWTYDKGTSAVIEDAYRYLGFVPYTPFAEVKTAYKKLLFKHHPDRNSSTPEALKRSTEISARINAAFQIIETYEASKASK